MQHILQLTVHFRNGNYEVEKAADYLRTINTWAQVRRGLKFRDAGGHVLREAGTPLKFPISGSNDVVLALRQYVRQAVFSSTQHLSVKLYEVLCNMQQNFKLTSIFDTWHDVELFVLSASQKACINKCTLKY